MQLFNLTVPGEIASSQVSSALKNGVDETEANALDDL
jgi:hypothetical protein